MSNPGFPPGAIEEAERLVAEHGSVAAASRASGIPDATLRKRYNASKADPAIRNSMDAVGTTMVPALAWAKTKPGEDGTAYSVLLKPDTSISSEERLERIRSAFDGMRPADPVIPPEKTFSDLCNVFPLFDVHWGMHAWGKETGGPDYDLQLAESDLVRAFEKMLQLTPFADTSVLIIGGDFFHADDNTAQTPAHKHSLDVDGRMFKVLDTAVRVLCYVIGRIKSRHRHTIIRVLRGNHDEHAHMVLTFALAEHYRKDSSVTVEKNPRDLFMHQWGRAAIFAHHGDKGSPTEFTLKLADVCPFWTASPHRYAYTGHRHKMAAERIGGLHWERLDAFCPPDSYGSTWVGRRGMKADTYHKHSGRVLTAIDPIERASE